MEQLVNEKNFILVDINKLNYAPWNYKEEGTEEQINKLVNNIKRNGLIVNLNIREIGKDKYEVLDGNHRLKAIKTLPEIKKVLCYNHGKINEMEAKRKCVELNESRFETNTLKLAEIYKELSTKYSVDDLALTCFHGKKDIDDLVNLTDFDWSHYDKINDDAEVKNNKEVFEFKLNNFSVEIDEEIFNSFLEICLDVKKKSEKKLKSMIEVLFKKEIEKRGAINE